VAKQLWFLRHGEAEPHGSRPDHDRRLTDAGRRQAMAAGAALAQLGLSFDLVAASPRIRAWETACLASEALGAEVVEHGPLDKGFDADDAQELARGLPANGMALLVGHEPDFSSTVRGLTGARLDFKKGGLAAVRLPERGGELIVILRPRELELMVDASRPREPAGAQAPGR
jgi:phosphohistidine phosphatase